MNTNMNPYEGMVMVVDEMINIIDNRMVRGAHMTWNTDKGYWTLDIKLTLKETVAEIENERRERAQG